MFLLTKVLVLPSVLFQLNFICSIRFQGMFSFPNK